MKVYLGRIICMFIFFCCSAFFYGTIAPKQILAEDEIPLSQLESTVNRIIDILEEGDVEKEWEQQKQRIVPLIDERLNPEVIAQRSLGRHWRDISDEQREEFTSLFLQLLKDTYINRLRSYSVKSDARFYEQRKRGDRAIVYSIVRKDQQEVPIDYRLIRIDDEWRIYDIVVEGVSLISNYRKQFDQIMDRGGYPELINRLRDKIGTEPGAE
ncbi:MAG: ABC transporter substrate-binding protein [Desulfobia sp.]